jgi:hypothetical protein
MMKHRLVVRSNLTKVIARYTLGFSMNRNSYFQTMVMDVSMMMEMMCRVNSQAAFDLGKAD